MNIIKITGKYLDQPLLVAKFNKTFPVALVAGGTLFTAHNVKQAPKEEKRNTAIKNSIIMGATVASALVAPKLANKVFKNKINTTFQNNKYNSKTQSFFIYHIIFTNRITI